MLPTWLEWSLTFAKPIISKCNMSTRIKIPSGEKINKIAKKVYRAGVAKTQSSFSTDPKSRSAPDNHVISVREVRLAAGAKFVVMVCGDIMTMPGLPKNPSAGNIEYIDGRVVGLF